MAKSRKNINPARSPSLALAPASPSAERHAKDIVLLKSEFPNIDQSLIAAIYSDTYNVDAARKTFGQISEDEDRYPEFSEGNGNMGEEREDKKKTDALEGLKAMFTKLKPYTVESTFLRCGQDLGKTADELLNRTLFEEEGRMPKSIDAFGEMSDREKTHIRLPTASGRRLSLPPESSGRLRILEKKVVSQWDKKKEEVEFVSYALGLPKSYVMSEHHANGGVLSNTVAALLDSNGSETIGDDPDEHMAELCELMGIFGDSVSRVHLDRLLRLCNDDKEAVFRLAEMLRRRPPTPLSTIKTNWNSQTTQSPTRRANNCLSRDENWITVGRSPRAPPSSISSSSASSSSYTPSSRQNPTQTATDISLAYREARNEAFARASEMYRRSRSNKLFSGAAAYFADVGRDYNNKTKEYLDLAAEEYVATNNTNTGMLDLHGLTVQQAIKFTREAITKWWVESDFNDVSQNPFRIVTGKGRHSKGGRPRVAPAVVQMLEREKWKIRVDGGEIYVFGVRR
jgi:DNA-nicking Smr family endonuclease